MLETEDFNNDKKDAGEIGAGHAVTALCEIVPAAQECKCAGGGFAQVSDALNPSVLKIGTN